MREIIDKIWKDLWGLVQEDYTEIQWNEFRKGIENNSLNCWNAHLYKLKLNKEIGQGPFAILLKDHFFSKRKVTDRDYHELPEIIRDICCCFDEIYQYNLLDRYLTNTKEYIIKFRTDKHNLFALGSALSHKYGSLKGLPIESYPSCTFSGKGKAVPEVDI